MTQHSLLDEEILNSPWMRKSVLEGYLEGFIEQKEAMKKLTISDLRKQHEEADSVAEQALTSGSAEEYEEFAEWSHNVLLDAIRREINRLEKLDESEQNAEKGDIE